MARAGKRSRPRPLALSLDCPNWLVGQFFQAFVLHFETVETVLTETDFTFGIGAFAVMPDCDFPREFFRHTPQKRENFSAQVARRRKYVLFHVGR